MSSISVKEALDKVQKSESYNKLLQFYPDLDFEEIISEKPELAEFIRQACVSNSVAVDDPLKKSDAPKLDEDFSKYFVINNLPIVNAEKQGLLIKKIVDLYQT